MKLAPATYSNDSFGIAEEGQFTFNASAQAFFIVMSGIAKDKIKYPVREVCTNAWDAARGDVEVTLPTWLDPVFKVRDFGKGLSHEQVKTVYTQMFMSTKTNSNDEVGGKGLGCKSPFAYLTAGGKAGSFNVNSYQGGVANFYLMSLGTDGKPKWQLLASMSTTERDGLEVSFGVRRDDFDRFQSAVHNIVWAFEPRPRVKNKAMPWVATPKIVRSGVGWQEFSRGDVPFYGPHIRMGCVYYPISLAQIGREDWPWHSQAILFETDIGSLETTASREDLSYDDRTVATLKARVEQMENEFLATMQAKLDDAEMLPDALTVLYRDDTLNGSSGLRSYLVNRLTWKGGLIKTNASWKRQALSKCSFTYRTAYDATFEQDGGRKSDSSFDLYEMLVDSKPPKFVIERKKSFSALKFKMAEAAGLIADGDLIVWLRPADEHVLNEVSAFLRTPELIDFDTLLPKQKKGKREAGVPVYLNLHTLTPTGFNESVTTDITQPGVYILRSDNKQKHGYSRRSYAFDMFGIMINNTSGWAESLREFAGKIVLPPIALAPAGQAERLDKLGWKKFTTQDLLREMVKCIDFTSILDSTFVLDRRMGTALNSVNMFPKLFPADIVDLAVKHHLMKTAYLSPNQSNTTRYNIYKSLGGTKTPNLVATVNSETQNTLTVVENRYPVFKDMMEIISDHSNYQGVPNEDILKAVAGYLTIFDAQAKV